MAPPALEINAASVTLGRRRVWSDVSFEVGHGEFLAVLGANGSGKTTLVRTILGLQPLSAGSVRVAGLRPRHGSADIGYVPQQRRLDPLTPQRARDVVRQGLDGHRWGIGWAGGERRVRVEAALESVDALGQADMPFGLLSGGEQQRVRIAQALVANPGLLLCDEPLVSLDLNSQRTITSVLDRRRRTHGTAVVFVTHEINPVLPYVDRVLYLARGSARIGSVDDVLSSATLSDLYGAPIEVVRVGSRIVVAGGDDDSGAHHDHHRGTT